MFDATDLEATRRAHDYEMGIEDTSERAWNRFYRGAVRAVILRNWDEKFTGGPNIGASRGLDGCDCETGYSIDGAYDAFEKGWTVERYVAAVGKARAELGL